METVVNNESGIQYIESNIEQKFLWYPYWNGKNIDISGGVGSVYYVKYKVLDDLDLVIDRLPLDKVGDGCYRMSFMTNEWRSGLYYLLLFGKYVDNGIEYEIRKEVTIELQAVDRMTYLVWRLRQRLMDYPVFYRLDRDRDGNVVEYWSWQNWLAYISDAVDRFNESAPTITHYDIDTIPVEGLLLDGAQGYAMIARGRIEKANTFSYSDAPTIDRSEYYKSEGIRLLSDFDSRVKNWKSMNRAGVGWVRRQGIPFTAIRYLSMMPLYKNIF